MQLYNSLEPISSGTLDNCRPTGGNPTPQPRLAQQSRRAKIHFSQTPFSFCPLAFGRAKKFLAVGSKSRGGGWVIQVFKPFSFKNTSGEVKADKKSGVPAKDSGETGPCVIKGYSFDAASKELWGCRNVL